MKQLVIGAAAAWLATAGGLCAATVYDCTMEGKGHGGDWVPNRVVILHDADKGIAKASDPAILHFTGAPVDARISGDTPQKVTFIWELQVYDKQSNGARMQYRATWNKATKRISVSANALQYNQIFRRQGKCAVSEVR